MIRTEYKVEITSASRDFDARERIILKDLNDSRGVNELTEDDVLNVADYAFLHVHNEFSQQNKDYEKLVLICDEGKFTTSSQSFMDAFIGIWDELDGEGVSIKVNKKASKNFSGNFLTCSLVY